MAQSDYPTQTNPYTFADMLGDKSARDFAAAAGTTVSSARRILQGGFVRDNLDFDGIARLLDADLAVVLTIRDRHNRRRRIRRPIPTFNALREATNIVWAARAAVEGGEG